MPLRLQTSRDFKWCQLKLYSDQYPENCTKYERRMIYRKQGMSSWLVQVQNVVCQDGHLFRSNWLNVFLTDRPNEFNISIVTVVLTRIYESC